MFGFAILHEMLRIIIYSKGKIIYILLCDNNVANFVGEFRYWTIVGTQRATVLVGVARDDRYS